MQYKNLLKNNILELPKKQPANVGFIEFFEGFLETFLSKVDDLDNQVLNIPNVGVDIHFIKNTQKTIVNGLISAVKKYYNGYPFKAYEEIENVLVNAKKDFYSILKQKEYKSGENFYRIRLKYDNFLFEPKDIFHIPFEKRGKVTTQKYSIPGFPSLYLGRTLHVCWEELNRPQLHKVQAIKINKYKKVVCLRSHSSKS